jgi:hypothetical protein
MKSNIMRIALSVLLSLHMIAIAIASESHKGHGDTMSHSTPTGTFEHKIMAEGIHTEFQIMSLASMNMTDTNGATHHIMAKFIDPKTNEQVENAVGKVKVISPDGKEQVQTLQNYGGVFAANFSFPEKGKYGVICLFKVNDRKRVVKFWYPHG